MAQGIAPGQRDEIGNMAASAAKKMADELGLDCEGAQNVIEQGGEFAIEMQRAARSALGRLCVCQDYASEEVASNYGYPSEYQGPKPIEQQIEQLAGLFQVDATHALTFAAAGLPELPSGTEGFFALPKLEAIARVHFPSVTDKDKQYCLAVEFVLKFVAKSRTFHNYREGQIMPNRFRQHAKSAHALEVLSRQQQGDILVVPAQFGLRHRGRGVRRARAVFSKPEFGLGSFNIGSMLLTHPERLVRWKQLHIDCAGDEFAPVADGRFVSAPIFVFDDGKVLFCAVGIGSPVQDFGSASGFLPQSA